MKKIFIIVTLILMGGALLLNRTAQTPISFSGDHGSLLYAFAMILFVSWLIASGLGRLNRESMKRYLRYAAIWVGPFLAVALIHSYRHELAGVKSRLFADLFPGKELKSEPGSISFLKSPNGHFYITPLVNGVPLRFLVDTGATDVVLSPEAARKLGFDIAAMKYDRIYQTANGIGKGASVELRDFSLGELHIKEMGASINEASMQNSLLGMSFFNRLKGYSVKEGKLTLYWH